MASGAFYHKALVRSRLHFLSGNGLRCALGLESHRQSGTLAKALSDGCSKDRTWVSGQISCPPGFGSVHSRTHSSRAESSPGHFPSPGPTGPCLFPCLSRWCGCHTKPLGALAQRLTTVSTRFQLPSKTDDLSWYKSAGHNSTEKV